MLRGLINDAVDAFTRDAVGRVVSQPMHNIVWSNATHIVQTDGGGFDVHDAVYTAVRNTSICIYAKIDNTIGTKI